MSYSKNRQGQTTVFQTEPERVPIPFGLVAIAALPVIFFLFISLTASVVFAVIFAALIWARMKVFPAVREKGGDISSRQEFGTFDSPARKSTLVVRLLLILVGGMIGPAQPAWAAPNPFNTGDVFVAISNGKVQHRDSTGFLIETLDTLQGGFTTGMAFDAEGSLYVTNFGAGNVVKFNNKGERIGIFGSGYSGLPESIVFDRAGNFYVGAVNGDNNVRKFDPQGAPLGQFNVATESRGSDWVDLAADQCTLFYTSEGSNVKRFNVCNNTQLPNFNVAPLTGSAAYALRIRPGKDVLVANTSVITRLDASGNFVRTYDAPGQDCWFALNLDRDGTSFWSADFCTANVYKFDIQTGNILSTFNTGTGSSTVFGLVVYGEVTAAAPPPTPSVQQLPSRPAIESFLSLLGINVPQITSRNAVVITHGWFEIGSADTAWTAVMAKHIRDSIDIRRPHNELWDVYYVDWSNDSTTLQPHTAYTNAATLVPQLADKLTPGNYNRIHFIAHSAGSNLVDLTAAELKRRAKLTRPQSPLRTSITFLDAYDPRGKDSTYGFDPCAPNCGTNPLTGTHADWAEHYVDTRSNAQSNFFALQKNSNLILAGAFNFTVDHLDTSTILRDTAADPSSPCGVFDAPVCNHAWPHRWYNITAAFPASWFYGYPFSQEYNGLDLPSYVTWIQGGCLVLSLDSTAVCTDGSVIIGTMPELRGSPTDQVWIDPRTVSVAKSDTGNIFFTIFSGALQKITLTTGSPVWVKLSNESQQEFNSLSFDYEFTSRAEGLLSVFLDDQVVFKADERYAKAGVNSSGNISVGNVPPGQHTLSLRLDRFTDAQSSVTISAITAFNTSIVRVTNQSPIANASAVPLARLGSLVRLSGAGSYDPDQKPLPLTFHWKQVSGPPVLLFGDTGLEPRFTPTVKGTYKFSLMVRDGQSYSAPVTVTTVVPALGDIDLDGDVDGIDISLVARAVGAQASGPNDLKDINGDGRIDQSDVSALGKMCTRAFCATK